MPQVGNEKNECTQRASFGGVKWIGTGEEKGFVGREQREWSGSVSWCLCHMTWRIKMNKILKCKVFSEVFICIIR